MFRITEAPIACGIKCSRDYSYSSPNKEEVLDILAENQQLKNLLISFMQDIGQALAGEASNRARVQRATAEDERGQE